MANANNAFFYLVGTLFDVYMWIIMMRVLLQVVRADFYNPISQLIWQLTQPIVRPLQKILPKFRQWDSAALALLTVIAIVYIHAVAAILGYGVSVAGSLWYAALKIVVLALNLFTFALFVQAILSWVGPGVSNPAGSILWSMNEPLLRPVRRVIPPMSGLDLSPLVLIVVLQFANLLVPLPSIFR
ncbi:MAG TPA: YggT family protein [Verrucomicrobiae bacterium]|nr:YggT family protein [Verrucomicrobiae bacterium]